MGDTTIEWTEKTWNPTRGCSLVSPGCTNCYAMGQAHRFSGVGKPFEGLTKKRVNLGVVWTGKVRLAPNMLALPLSWKKPQRVFVNSMSDLFHEELTNEEIAAVFGVMASTPRHTFQILTKRAKRMREWFDWIVEDARIKRGPLQYRNMNDAERVDERLHELALKYVSMPLLGTTWKWPLPNVWLGVSAEDQQRADERVPELLATPATVRFVSYEPALGPIDFQTLTTDDDSFLDALDDPDGTTLDWVIVGGESGPRARPFDVEWARSTVRQCQAADVACFVKQLGRVVRRIIPGSAYNDAAVGTVIDATLKDRKGGDMREWPADLRVRQFPKAVSP